MLDPSFVAGLMSETSGGDLLSSLAGLLPEGSISTQASAIEAALRTPAGQAMRGQVGKWIVEKFVPADALVPKEYAQWRAPVRDAMLFVVSRFSEPRLAVKILEQINLPPDASPETHLLQLIVRVPGLQKLGQVLARNRKLKPSMRRALIQLENGIRDVTADDMYALIERELGARLQRYEVETEREILSEASVSAVLRFTWRNPENGERERGVFKVLKPHIPVYFAEDMNMLAGLAKFFGTRYREYGFAKNVLTDTFTKVRRLLQHEVDFVGEQNTLKKALKLYPWMPGVRVPRPIEPLCTSTITALSEESGLKVTDAVARLPEWRRGQVAQQLIEALIAVPLFAPEENALFHADPHAGNLLYDESTRELTILDWALTESLSREQRRHLALLVFMVGLSDPVGTFNEVRALSEPKIRRNSKQERLIRETVDDFFDALPLRTFAGAVDAMRLLQQIAASGVRFPAPLIMMSKVLFTLDGILEDINGAGVSMALTVARHPVNRWAIRGVSAGMPLKFEDWIAVQCSAAFYPARASLKIEKAILDRLLPAATPASPADQSSA
jgi:ubiquinone biosynthesis protein